jgi:hypothetical protein
MRALCNSAIEPGTNLFEIALVQFGTVNRPATRRVVKVLASTANGAKRIVRSRYPRSSSYEVIAKTAALPLNPAESCRHRNL